MCVHIYTYIWGGGGVTIIIIQYRQEHLYRRHRQNVPFCCHNHTATRRGMAVR